MTKSNATQIACIGGGYWGKNLIRNLYDLGVLSCVCEVDAERLAELKATYPSTEFTETTNQSFGDPNTASVVIATPAASHGELVRQALLADKDVFVEKPLCLSVEEGKQLVALASERRRVLMVGHLLWYHPAVLQLKKLVEEGELGRVEYIYSNRLNLGKIRREENILWSFAPHDISVILGLVGEMPDSVKAQGGKCLHSRECIEAPQSPLTDGLVGLRVLTVLQQRQDALVATPWPSKAHSANGQQPYFVHDSAVLDENVEIGDGTTIWHFSHVLRNCRLGNDCRIGQNVVIGPNVRIGNGVKIQNNVSVYEGVTLEDEVFCGPSMVFTNVFNPRSEIRRMDELRPTLVRRGATLGANCT